MNEDGGKVWLTSRLRVMVNIMVMHCSTLRVFKVMSNACKKYATALQEMVMLFITFQKCSVMLSL